MKQALLAVAALSAMLVTTFAQAQGPARRATTPAPVQPAPQVETPAPQVETPAPQDGTTAPQDGTTDNTLRLQQIKEAIQEQERRSRGATGGIIAGAVIIGVGFIASVAATSKNEEDAREEAEENGESEYTYETDATAATVGVAIGVPIIVMSIISKSRANRKKGELNSERIRLGVAPAGVGGAEATMLTLRWDF